MSISTAMNEHNAWFLSQQEKMYDVFSADGADILKNTLSEFGHFGDELKEVGMDVAEYDAYLVDTGSYSFLLVTMDGEVHRLSPGYVICEDSVHIGEGKIIPSTVLDKGDGMQMVRFIPANTNYEFEVIDESAKDVGIDPVFLEAMDELFSPHISLTMSHFEDEDEALRETTREMLEASVAEQLIAAYYKNFLELALAETDWGEESEQAKNNFIEVFQEVVPQYMKIALQKLNDAFSDESSEAEVLSEEENEELDLAEFSALSVDERLRRFPLWTAVTASDAEVALKLAQETVDHWVAVDEPAEINGNHNITPLAMASAQQLPSFLDLLIKEGADINAMSSDGFVPLTFALQGESMDNFRLLIEKGANPDPLEKGVGSFSPLAMAAQHGLVEAVKVLIDLGVNVNWVGIHGGDALKCAAQVGHLECVELLIAAGANPASFDNEGFSSIHNAVDNGHSDVVLKLLDAGVDVDLRVESSSGDEGRTVLHRACSVGDFELVRKLVERGASVKTVAADSSTPLLSAVLYAIDSSEDATGLIQYLIKMGAEPDLQLLFVALQRLPVSIFAEFLRVLIPKMDSPLPIEDTELDRDGITRVLRSFINKESDLERRNDIHKSLKDSGFEIPPMEEKDGVSSEDSGPAEAQRAKIEAINYMPDQADLDLDVDRRSVSLSDDEFDDRWNRLIDIQNRIADNFIDELAEYQDQQTQEEYDTLMSHIEKMNDQNRYINNIIDSAANSDLGEYATTIKNVALVTLGLCQKYRVFDDYDTYGYDANKKMIQLDGEDFFYLG